MSIVVEQTLPYTSSQLQFEDPKRWSRLLPLMRPTIKAVEITNGQIVMLDTALAESKNVLIAAIGSVGNISSKILSESNVAVFTTEPLSGKTTRAEDLIEVLKHHNFPIGNGVIVVQGTATQGLGISEGLVSVQLKFDHTLSLLAAVNSEINHFTKSIARTTSKFHPTKAGTGPSVAHAAEIAEFNSAKVAINKDLETLLTSKPARADEVYSIHYSDVNGLSRLENNILAHEISEFFAKKNLPSYISHSTIIDNHSQARGWAISICPIPATLLTAQPSPANTLAHTIGVASATKPREGTSKIQFSDPQIRKIITEGCDTVIKAEPTITEYDTIVGDGDCGYTLRDGAKQVLSFITNADLSKLPSTLSELVDDLEVNMGGTSGALYCIFLSSLAQNLWEASTFAEALQRSLDHLLKYTRARLGDRTCLDCLIPFVETLKTTGDAKAALNDAAKGVETTKKLEAKLGRSSYLDEATTRGVPDPGAYGLLMLLEGMVIAK
ncbi:Dihydroxyacetone kinase [Lachnellula suecica]|uniref:Dihydroxyacetone kinase n=1 Tax=Lachnellula suecica TaxID=602035 RepID=A0A8T9CE12_9HELO|nr:Dihydroxyacetone kinase [Lachnellula suecica]